MQQRDQVRLAPGQLQAQQLGEQVVVAVPVAVVVEGDQEQVGLLQLGQQLGRPLGLQHRVAQRPRQPLQDRGADHEAAQRLGLAGQDLGAQVVDDVAVAGLEAGDERARVGLAPQRQPGQVQPGRPALGPLPQPLGLVGGQLQAHRLLQQRPASALVKPSSAMRSSTSSPQARSRARASGGSTRVATIRCTLAGRWSTKNPRLAWHTRVGDQVVVVQHQHQVGLAGGELVEQLRQDHLGEDVGRARALEQGERALPEAGLDHPERLDDIGPEPHRVVVAVVQRQPGDPPGAVVGPPPLGQQGGLARTGRGVDQAQPPLGPGLQQPVQPGPGDQPGPDRRRAQLGPQEDRPRRARRSRRLGAHGSPSRGSFACLATATARQTGPITWMRRPPGGSWRRSPGRSWSWSAARRTGRRPDRPGTPGSRRRPGSPRRGALGRQLQDPLPVRVQPQLGHQPPA